MGGLTKFCWLLLMLQSLCLRGYFWPYRTFILGAVPSAPAAHRGLRGQLGSGGSGQHLYLEVWSGHLLWLLWATQASRAECSMVSAHVFHGGGCRGSHGVLPSWAPLPVRATHACPRQGVRTKQGQPPASRASGSRAPYPPRPLCPARGPFGQSWEMPLACLICAPASETRVWERIINTPFCGFWVILPIWDNNSHYALWSFLIKMTFPLSLKVEISA